MPLREQSRIKADTVAEECTCEECPAPAPDAAPPGFRIIGRSGPALASPPPAQWVRYRDSRDAPRQWGTPLTGGVVYGMWLSGCFDILEPIQAPASEPSAPPAGVPACKAPGWCGLPYGDDKVPREWHGPRGMPWGVPIGGSPRVLELPAYCSGECQNGRPLSPPPSDPVTVATGGNCPTVMDLIADLGKSLVRPLSEELHAWANYRERPTATMIQCAARAAALEAELTESKRTIEAAHVANAEFFAETTAARAEVEQLRGKLPSEPAVRPNATIAELSRRLVDTTKSLVAEYDRATAARAEVERWKTALADETQKTEQLRGKLAEAEKEAREWQEAAVDNEQTADERVLAAGDQATARERSMRDAAANVARGWRGGGPMTDEIAAAIKRLPLDTGTATDTGGDAQADAIKAAVDKEKERCLAWVDFWVRGYSGHVFARMLDNIRSGEAAHGAVTPAKGGE